MKIMKLMQNFSDNETGELFYKPLKLSLSRVVSWIRIWVWGFCPKCNSDSPELYDCKVCQWDTSSPFKKDKKKEYWNNWKLQNYLNETKDK